MNRGNAQDKVKNVVFLSPHFPFNYPNFCKGLHAAGVNVFGIDQIEYAFSPLQEVFKDYFKVSDLHQQEELIQVCEHIIERYGPIDRLESHNEYWLQMQAGLRSHFNIPGIKNDQIHTIKRKSEMKRVFHEAGMTITQGGLVPNLEIALKLAQEIGYPVMAKPDIGVGACGCKKICNEEELKTFFQCNSSVFKDYVMEEFVEGELCSFDGLTDAQGNIVFYTAHLNSAGTAEVVERQLDAYFYSLRTIPADLELIGRQTVKAFSVRENFFHMEYIRRHCDNKLIPIEVNIRPPGGGALDMCNYACDIDLYHEWSKIIAGMDEPFHYERKYHCLTAIRRYKNCYAHSHQDILDKWGHRIVHHEKTVPLHTSTMGDYYYIARSPDLAELFKLQNDIQVI